jgi:hypothetical protein
MTRGQFAAFANISAPLVARMIKNGELSLVAGKIPAREYYKLIDPNFHEADSATDERKALRGLGGE